MSANSVLICLVCFATVVLATGRSEDKPGSPALAIAGPIAAIRDDSLPIEDPFPIQRVRASEADIPNILKHTEVGPLVHLKRDEFEAQVRSAARHIAEAKVVPRITHTRYVATLVGNDLLCAQRDQRRPLRGQSQRLVQ